MGQRIKIEDYLKKTMICGKLTNQLFAGVSTNMKGSCSYCNISYKLKVDDFKLVLYQRGALTNLIRWFCWDCFSKLTNELVRISVDKFVEPTYWDMCIETDNRLTLQNWTKERGICSFCSAFQQGKRS